MNPSAETGAVVLVHGAWAVITTAMFFTTSTMFITTPGTIVSIHGMMYMSLLGLFFFKDVISWGGSLYLIGHFGKRAILAESRSR